MAARGREVGFAGVLEGFVVKAPGEDVCVCSFPNTKPQGPIFRGFWAQRPYYLGVLGYFELEGKGPECQNTGSN